MLRASIFDVDKKVVARLSPKQYSCFLAAPGSHVLGQRWPIDISFGIRVEKPVDWEAGETYYYAFQPNGAVGFSTIGTVNYTDASTVSPADPAEAGAIIQTFKYVPASG